MQRKFISQRSTRSCLPVLVFFILFLLLLTTTSKLHNGPRLPKPTFRVEESRKSQPPIPWHDASGRRPELSPGQCPPNLSFLRNPSLGLTENIRYTRRCIKPIFRAQVNRDILTNISTPLINTAKITTINLTSCSHPDLPPCEPLPLHVPTPYPQQQYPHLIFGVASTYERMQNAIDGFAHWLSGTSAHLHGIIADADSHTFNLTLLEETYRSAGILATFISPSTPPQSSLTNQPSNTPPRPTPIEHHHFILVRHLLSLSTPETHWISLIDDDTFFPSLYPLAQSLENYEHSKPYWLGALSDDFDAVKLWGFMAFGGAGVFLSLPLARQIVPHTEECIASASISTGDGILRDCLYTHTRTKLTVVPGLYQHDFRGDVSGFYESGINPLSVHHWRGWYKEPIPKMAGVVDFCGGCWLQRWKFGNDMLLANGYSITEFLGDKGLEGIDLGRIEGTWLHPDEEYDFSYGPLRERLEEEKKKSYKMVDGWEGKGGYRQVYVHRKSDAWQVEDGAMDEVIELVWEV